MDERDRVLRMIRREMRRVIAYAERPEGGMQVPFHGDFVAAAREPGLLNRFAWYVREIDSVIGAEPEDE